MTMPRVSVVMPVYNGGVYVAEAVESILNQTFGDFEFVIGDDGSNDGTSDVLQDFARRDPRIRLYRRAQSSGPVGSANWVVRESRCALVARMDADDVSQPERLQRQIAIMAADPTVGLVGSLWEGIDQDGTRIRPAERWRLIAQSPFAPFPHASIMFRREVFEQAGGYRQEAEFWEDLDLFLRIETVSKIVVVIDPLVQHRLSDVSTRIRNDRDRVEAAVERMYRAVDLRRQGLSYEPVMSEAARPRRLRPRTLVACGSTRLWSGQSPRIFRRLLSRGDLRFNTETMVALGWASLATLSPAALRWAIRVFLQLRANKAPGAAVVNGPVTWRP